MLALPHQSIVEYPVSRKVSQHAAEKAARRLYNMGLNVLPQPYGAKGGFVWGKLQYTRLPYEALAKVFAGHCNVAVMVGRTSLNLFVIDCESEESFKFHQAQMRARGIPVWSTRSYRGGHIWMFCKEGEVVNIAPGILSDAEIRGNSCFVLAPPSLHPKGVFYLMDQCQTGEPPTVSIKQIDWLEDISGMHVDLHAFQPKSSTGRQPVEFDPLSRRTRAFLEGHVDHLDYPDKQLFSAACDLAGNGVSEEDAQYQLKGTALGMGMRESDIWRNIHNAYSEPREPARNLNPRARNGLAWQCAQAYAKQHTWVGRVGRTDAKVFDALIERAQFANKDGTFRAAERELSERVHAERKTIRKSLRRMLDAAEPLIVFAGSDRRSGANLFRFSDTVLKVGRKPWLGHDEMTPLSSFPGGSFNGVISQQSDLLESKAIGAEGVRVYLELLNSGECLIARRIAERTHLPLSVVQYRLGKLKRFGLVEHSTKPRGYVAVRKTDEELQAIVQVAGTAGKTKRRKAQHARERAWLVARNLIKHREMYDSHNLPREMQPHHQWKCPDCGHSIKFKHARLPNVCHECGCVDVRWKLVSRCKQIHRRRHVAENKA